jgi:hypothetical protein
MASRPDDWLPLVSPDARVGPVHLGSSPPPVAEAVPARHPLAAFRDTRLRHRVHGAALMLVGGASVSTGLLVVGGGLAGHSPTP